MLPMSADVYQPMSQKKVQVEVEEIGYTIPNLFRTLRVCEAK
jgi:hypothetical protein